MINSDYKSLTWEENMYLFRQLENGKLSAREELFNGNINLIYTVISRKNFRYDEDLFQEGAVGLIKAIDTFDINRDIKFSTYAFRCILTEFRNAINVSNEEKLQKKILSYIEDVYKITGINPSNKEISIMLNLDESRVEKLLALKFNKTSFNKTVFEDGNTLLEMFSSKDNVEKVVLDKIYTEKIFDLLTEKEKVVMKYRCGFIDGTCWTLEKIASLYGLTRETIRQIEKKALNKIKTSSVTKINSIPNEIKKDKKCLTKRK